MTDAEFLKIGRELDGMTKHNSKLQEEVSSYKTIVEQASNK